MRLPRLKWICKAIEYDMLTSDESNLLFKFIEDFIERKLTTMTAEEKLEGLFAEIQWREVETKSSYEVWSKEQNKESVPIQSAIPTAVGGESAPEALS